jgi:hypothetical protein
MSAFKIALVASTALALAVLTGCASEEAAPAGAGDPAAAEEDFVGKGGVTLTSAADKDLSISLMMLDGVKPKTKAKRFIKATVSRKGQSFGAFCALSGQVEKASQRAKIGCSVGVTTVSNDDDESLAFDIVLARGAGGDVFSLEGVSYSGDFTFLEKQTKILGYRDEMERGDWKLALTAREGKDVNKNVLLLARTMLDGSAPLLAEKVKSEEVEQPVSVKSLSFFLDEKMSASVALTLGRTGALRASVDEVSILVAAGEPAKGTLASSAITAKLKAKLPQ